MTSSNAARWALLADPEAYGWSQLVSEKRAVWDGIKNARAQQNLRHCKVGDLALIYHTAPDKAILGTARVVREAFPDPTAPERAVIEIEPIAPLPRPLTLAEMKADSMLSQMSFVKMPRVAVQPVTADQWERVIELSGA